MPDEWDFITGDKIMSCFMARLVLCITHEQTSVIERWLNRISLYSFRRGRSKTGHKTRYSQFVYTYRNRSTNFMPEGATNTWDFITSDQITYIWYPRPWMWTANAFKNCSRTNIQFHSVYCTVFFSTICFLCFLETPYSTKPVVAIFV